MACYQPLLNITSVNPTPTYLPKNIWISLKTLTLAGHNVNPKAGCRGASQLRRRRE